MLVSVMLGDSGGEAPGKTRLWKAMNRSNDVNVICINQSTSILPMSISLVSLVVLGIFGRNTGFGPSMSLNNRTFMFHMFGEYVHVRGTHLHIPWFWRHGETRGRRVQRSDVLVSVAGCILCDTYLHHIS